MLVTQKTEGDLKSKRSFLRIMWSAVGTIHLKTNKTQKDNYSVAEMFKVKRKHMGDTKSQRTSHEKRWF